MTKAEIRKIFLEKRMLLTEAEHRYGSQQICDRFFVSANLTHVSVLHTFIPVPDKREPDTWLIIDRLRREYPHIHIAVPRIAGKDLQHVLLQNTAQLRVNQWGIAEPVAGTEIPARAVDMVLVPLLAFDIRGHRVGYGKGYYDRFLNACRPDTARVGVSLFGPLQAVPHAAHDVPLTACVTPDAYYQF
jgi:5-formyltetrahydrofolate cyclo-ligase